MGKKILFFQRSFIPFFKLHLCYLIKAKMAACQLPGLQLQRQGRLKHARVTVCVCVCLRVHVFYQVMNSESNNTGPVNGDLLYFGSLCTCTHTHWHFNLSLSQHARGAPHDADVVNSGME